VLTKITYGSCTRGGAPLLEPEENQTTIHFCSRGSAFMPFAIPGDLDKNLIYTCSLGTVPTGGEQKSAELTLNPTQAVTQRPGLALDRTTARPGETVTASAQGAQVFTRKGDYGLDGLVLTAHADDFRVYAYRNGMLDRSDVTVTEFTPVRLAVSTDAEEVKAGETVNVTVLVTNTDTRERNVNVRVGGETKSAAVGAGASKSPAFRFATDESTAVVQAFAESEGFSTSAAIPIKVERPQNILDQIIRMITEFLAMLLGG
jgi:hypothetical protein